MASEDLYAISIDWLKSLEAASSTGDVMLFVGHFLSDGWFRDILCFSWNHRTLSGLEKLRGFLSEIVDGKSRLEYSSLRDLKIDDHTINAPSPFKSPGSQGIEGVQAAFTFNITNPAALGRGPRRIPHGLYEGRKITWEEDVDAKFGAIEADHTVLIIVGEQTGLMCAARLRMLGIRALVIKKHARVGDCWRQRYPNLTLHTPAYQSSILYSPYPTNFPKYIPKGNLANFLESYAVNQELCIWLSSTITSTPIYDSLSAIWTVEVQHGVQKVILNPNHLVIATGSGSPHIPTWNGMNGFQGALYHSDFHKDAEQFRGKRIVIVGVSPTFLTHASCSTGNEPVMKATRALLGNEITDQLLPPEVWVLDSEGELNQAYRHSGHPGLWFVMSPFGTAHFLSKHLGLQILARELGIA